MRFRLKQIKSQRERFYAVDYDLGVNGVAYYDMDTANYRISTGKESMGNRGRTYRNDGVDIYEDSIQRETWYVGHTEEGEWLQYTIDVLEEGNYNLKIAVSANNGGGALSVSSGFGQEQPSISIPSTGGNENWELIVAKNIPLKKGINHLRIRIDKGGFDFKSITFSKS